MPKPKPPSSRISRRRLREINQSNAIFWKEKDQSLNEDLANSNLSVEVFREQDRELKRIASVFSEGEKQVLFRHTPNLYELIEREKARISDHQSLIAKKSRPKSKPTIRSLTIQAMQEAKSSGMSLKEMLKSKKQWVKHQIEIKWHEECGKDIYEIFYYGDIVDLAPSSKLTVEANSHVRKQLSWKSLEEHWSAA